ncbi:unnamed protein product [Thlaspi arvense]|uniref:Uncharacterized protein n=1 Tax=Thlaspi arvense TaxID=13288 RepID=A0AAU9S2P6_THLAR|nr:unnamed protein product [Thlaspi arvense]
MPFTMKIPPTDINSAVVARSELKSHLKRLFDRPFTNVLRSAASEKPFPVIVTGKAQCNRDGSTVTEFEPSSFV